MTWKTHPFYTGYEVSKAGQIRSLARKKIRKTRLDKDGYKRLNISVSGKIITVKIHQMVAETFLIKKDPGDIVNHKNLKKKNCRLKNLEYVTVQRNNQHCFENLGNPKAKPVTIGGKVFYSKRQAERITGLNRKTL